MKRTLIVMICLILCLAACAAPQKTETPAGPVSGLTFSGTTLYGEPVGSDQFQDYDLVIVNCWAEWCGPCVGELPEIERIHQEYPNVLILGVLVGTNSVDTAKATLEKKGVTYPALEPAGDLVALSERSMYIPATYFFDKNGNEVGEEIVGSMDYNGWKTAVDNLLG